MNRIALVTGASAGIGEATARRLAREPDVSVVLVARREERLRALTAELGPRASVIGCDLTGPGAPARVAETVRREHGALHLLVNNAGASWRGTFADTGWDNVARHLAVDLEAPVRLTEALLPLLRETAKRTAAASPPAVVNVSSAGIWAGRPGAGGYGAAKAALLAWSESLRAEELAGGVHVGLVLPGFVATEGFPAAELRSRPLARRFVGRPETVAEAILDVAGWTGRGPRPERYAPRLYGALAVIRALAPGLMRRGVGRGGFTTATRPDLPDR